MASDDGPWIRRERPFSLYEGLKTYVLGPIFGPLRFIGAMFWLFQYFIVARIVLIGLRTDQLATTPISPRRRRILDVWVSFTARMCLFCVGFFRLHVERREKPRPGDPRACVVVANHTSWLDILCLVAVQGTSFIAKGPVANIPLVGYAAKSRQTLFVSSSKRSRGPNVTDPKPTEPSTTERIVERQHNPEAWPNLLMFPEGTTTNGSVLLKFRRGAFVAGAPVLPVAIKYPADNVNFSLAYDSILGSLHVARLACQFVNSAKIVFLPVYVPSAEEKADPQLYADNVARVIAKELDVPISEATFNDKLRYLKKLRGDSEKRRPTDEKAD